MARLLNCTSPTAKRAAEELQAGGWLEFQPGPPGIGDSYRPGPALKDVWERMLSEDGYGFSNQRLSETLDLMRWLFDDAQ